MRFDGRQRVSIVKNEIYEFFQVEWVSNFFYFLKVLEKIAAKEAK